MKKQASEPLRLALLSGTCLLLLFVFDYVCPFRHLLGISCVGCGMTRSWISLLQGNFEQAFAYHPLFWMVPVAAVLFWFRKRPLCKTLLWVCVGVSFAVYLLRLFLPGDTVVTFAPESGAIYQGMKNLWKLIFE